MGLSDDEPEATLRDAEAADAEGIARLFDEGGQGVISFLTGTPLSPGMAARMIGPSVADPTHPLTFRNAVVAVDGRTLVGMAIGHPSEQDSINAQLRFLVSAERLALIAPLLEARVPDSLFIPALCVTPRWRRRGVGATLIEAMKARARALGRPRVSAIVTTRNEAARSLLRHCGFAVSRFIGLHPDERLPGPGELFLMAAPSGLDRGRPPAGA